MTDDTKISDLQTERKKKEPAKKAIVSEVQKVDLNTLLGRLNDEYAVILRGAQVLIMRHWIGEDGKSNLTFLNRRDFLLFQANNKLWVGDGEDKKAIKIAEAWLEWPKRACFEEVYFEPCGKPYLKRYNLWRGFGVKQKTGTDKLTIFFDHIKTNICKNNQEHYDWIMSWLADLIQNPGRKIGTAVVLRGEMGTGKGQFAKHIGKLLGIHYLAITQSTHLTGKFNGHMADKLLMFVDEGWWSEERNGAGILRGLITETEVTIEMKNRDAVSLPNFTRFIIAANADWVVPLGMGDERRFFMIDVGLGVQKNTEYFKAMQAEMDSGGYEQLLTYLLEYKYDENVPRNILQTEVLFENKIYSMPDEIKWWHECLIKEKIGDYDITEDGDYNYIKTHDFYSLYQNWARLMNYKVIPFNILPKKLRKVVALSICEKYSLEQKRERFYYIPTLSILRQKFEEFIKYQIDWNDI